MRINLMSRWREFNPQSDRSVADDFQDTEWSGEKKIIRYLLEGKVTVISPSAVTDIFTGERIASSLCIMTDGVYSWTNELPYYIEKYHLKIEEPRFLEKVYLVS